MHWYFCKNLSHCANIRPGLDNDERAELANAIARLTIGRVDEAEPVRTLPSSSTTVKIPVENCTHTRRTQRTQPHRVLRRCNVRAVNIQRSSVKLSQYSGRRFQPPSRCSHGSGGMLNGRASLSWLIIFTHVNMQRGLRTCSARSPKGRPAGMPCTSYNSLHANGTAILPDTLPWTLPSH